uniref:Zinc-ribbon domain-containing protein n=1 Tax=candidate division WOR-3 bacterium TaxID=2052148 RepID=A0A7V3KNF9_UNCW3
MAPKICSKCGFSNNDDAKFCFQCGSPLKQNESGSACPKCGCINNPGANFCYNCGASLKGTESDSFGENQVSKEVTAITDQTLKDFELDQQNPSEQTVPELQGIHFPPGPPEINLPEESSSMENEIKNLGGLNIAKSFQNLCALWIKRVVQPAGETVNALISWRKQASLALKEIKDEFDKKRDILENAINRGKQIIESVNAHLSQIGYTEIEFKRSVEPQKSATPWTFFWGDLNHYLTKAESLGDELCKIERSNWKDTWSCGDYLIFGCGIYILFAILAGIFYLIFKSTTALWVSLGVIIGIFLIRPVFKSSSIKRTYLDLIDQISNIEMAIFFLQTEITRDYQRKEQAINEFIRQRFNEGMIQVQKTCEPLAEVFRQKVDKLVENAGLEVADWQSPFWAEWAPFSKSAEFVRIGTLRNDSLSQAFEIEDYLFSALAGFPMPFGKSILYLCNDSESRNFAIENIQSIIARLLATNPPGKALFSFIDPVNLGQNVAGFFALGDEEEKLIGGSAWTDPEHISKKLTEIISHIEEVIQKRLRNVYATIEEYNEQAGELSEPYRFLVIFDFPYNFNEESAQKLLTIAQNGPRCGIYPIVLADTRIKSPYGFEFSSLEEISSVIECSQEGHFIFRDLEFPNFFALQLDPAPPNEIVERVTKEIAPKAKAALKVEVSFSKTLSLAQFDGQTSLWAENTISSIQAPLGVTGANRVLSLNLGRGIAHHALLVGQTGSGKSNLMHVLITSLCLKYAPEELELYLIDFKKGVEFKRYAQAMLPHAKVIAIESEREFGLSVLQRLDKEIVERGELFRKAGVNDIEEFRKSGGQLPRILLLVDEFHEFFTVDDSLSREATLILDRLIKQGRGFGMHVLLASQTLAGSYTLPRSTTDQMAVRIALQCKEADSRLILADDNPFARYLGRPGEGIYNDKNGLVEGNCLFQVAFLKEEEQEMYLNLIKEKARSIPRKPIVFEGNEPARLEDSHFFRELLDEPKWPKETKSAIAYLGEPIAILPPVGAKFLRQGGKNLLVVTREEKEGVAVLGAAMLSLALQYRPDNACFFVLDLTNVDSPWADLPEEICDALPHQVEILGKRDFLAQLEALASMINQRLQEDIVKGPEVFLVLLGMHRARDLRAEDYYGISLEKKAMPRDLLQTIIREGPDLGVHVLAWSDTVANASRVLDRRLMAEFCMRVAGVMNQEDSMQLLDDPAAGRIDKPNRMLFYTEERPGVLVKFRPYDLPDFKWIREIGQRLLKKKTD